MWLILALACSTPPVEMEPNDMVQALQDLAVHTDAQTPKPTPQHQVTVATPHIRAMPPGAPNTAAFMTLHNAGPELALVSATATTGGPDSQPEPVARSVELHTHLMEGGMMRMRQVERIELPTGRDVALEPGGLHIMLIGLSEALPAGALVSMELGFSDSSVLVVQVPVQKIQAGH